METNNSQLVIYKAPDGDMSIDVTVRNETVWFSQGQMAELFGKDQSVIARHISNVFKEGELEKESNMQILHITLSKFKPTQVYSLDVIISVGYRVNSKNATAFRIWANQVLKQYLLQGYAINERVAAQKYDLYFRRNPVGEDVSSTNGSWLNISTMPEEQRLSTCWLIYSRET